MKPTEPEPLFNEIDSGIQQSFTGDEVEVIVKGKGLTVQISMDDLLKLKEVNGDDHK